MSVPIQDNGTAMGKYSLSKSLRRPLLRRPEAKKPPKWRSAHAWKWLFVVVPNPTTWSRADKGWAVKPARPSKKMWCSRLGLCLEMSLVFDFGQGLQCGLSIRHCRCHWIMAAWFVFLHFFLVPLCWYAVSERQMLPNISFKGFLLLLPWLYYWIIFSFYYSLMSMLFRNKNN